jgi:hypothetical protein
MELFKLKDAIWKSTGFAINDKTCVQCCEQRLGRKSAVHDMDLSFPWWGVARPEYYQGIQDGISGHSNSPAASDGQYDAGFNFGVRLANNSSGR